MINVLIVEDDERIIQFCEDAINSLKRDIEIKKVLNAEDALVVLDNESVDGAFIDIELPGINGFELAKMIRSKTAYHLLPIIFATGTDKDLPETYKQYHNFDYIVKPYSKDSFIKIALRFFDEIEIQKRILSKPIEREIAFRNDEGFARILFSDILYATTTIRRKVLLVTRQCEYFRSNITLENLHSEINEKMFVQCSKSSIVNVSNIEEIRPFTNKTWDIYFRGVSDKTCQLSLRYKKVVDDLLKESVSLTERSVRL